MKKIILASLISIFSLSFYSQTLISDADTLCDCSNTTSSFNDGSVVNFQDASGGTDYLPGSNDTITFCPDATTSKLFATFAIDQGFSWNVDASDTLYVYDGPNASSPLLGAYNSTTDPNGMFLQSSWNNPSGCLTFVFISNGADEGTGWDANISCGNPPQPFEVHMEAYITGTSNGGDDIVNDLNPIDTGYVDVCLGDSIQLVALPLFPNDPSNTNNGGYDQINNYVATWEFSDGTVLTGDTILFVPPYRSGFLVKLRIDDGFPQVETISAIIRVSTVPSFATCRALSDTICAGEATQLFGGIVAGDTVGVEGQPGSIDIDGSFATLTYLPDGSGQNYTTDIAISGFPTSTTIQNASDISRICLSMEHSFLGDLEMTLTCPNGQSVVIFNAYSGTSAGSLAVGGFGGGGTYIGGADDSGNGTVGVCEEYCFSERPGSLPSWANGYNTMVASGPSIGTMIEPGIYNPEEAFFPALQGCPVNGNWTITVRDNQGIDDGYICEWGIFLSGTLDPNTENYTPSIVNEFWSPDPTIITGDNDTAIVVLPPLGTTGYTFNVEDNFGCTYDTTINVTAIQGPSVEGPLEGCVGANAGVQFANTYAPEGGSWEYPSDLTLKFPSSFINQGFTSNTPGTYTVSFLDNQCSDTTTAQITFLPIPTAEIVLESDTICRGDSLLLKLVTSDPNNIVWNNNPLFNTQAISISEAGIYTAEVTNQCGTATDEFELFIQDCVIPNVITPNGDGQNDYFYTNIAENYTDTHVIIYNRWGRKVYENKNYDNSWDGVNNGGGKLAAGTYYYVLTYDGGSIDEKGFITLMK